jgi:hypothetical protein
MEDVADDDDGARVAVRHRKKKVPIAVLKRGTARNIVRSAGILRSNDKILAIIKMATGKFIDTIIERSAISAAQRRRNAKIITNRDITHGLATMGHHYFISKGSLKRARRREARAKAATAPGADAAADSSRGRKGRKSRKSSPAAEEKEANNDEAPAAGDASSSDGAEAAAADA